MNAPTISEVWVCTTCYFSHHYGEDEQASPEAQTATDAGYEAWAGMFTDNTDSETGEGITEFSWQYCQVCDSRLGGSRFRLAWWES